ncbi:MmgE/PrpD family protein [Salmonella enterica subsp. enterica serovar Morehead]|nr:MmgE/PrpD family protein [Salmonella enterica subsp. enterica serovar Kottbus]EEM2539465.1 MmgE/PrpD family protein [Salmonella enterica subsp. enterica serovar Morehead]EHN5889123.1 MmgE/PrpD family protein [Salmonella enterica subsp. enterica serovar Newport]
MTAKQPTESDYPPVSQMCTDFVARLRPEDIPAGTLDAVKRYVLDWLGCAVAGAATPSAEYIRKTIRSLGSNPQAGAIGEKNRLSVTHAAMSNGYYGHILEMDDVDRTSISHPATVNIPAALAIAELRGKNGMEMLTSIVAGYEVMLRVGSAVTPGHYKIWHTTATTGVFGAAMAAGKLLGLDKQHLDWAMGNAGTMSAGLWEFLSDAAGSKLLHAGMAASHGVLVALLAENGLSGATHILEGNQGFFAGYARQDVNPAYFQDFGRLWRSSQVSFKPYPCCRHTHSAIDAANAIRELAGGEEIREANISTYATALQVAGNNDPRTTLEAKFSIRYCVASAMLRGLAQESHFTEEAIAAPVVRTLFEKTSTSVADDISALVPDHWPCRINAVTVSGRKLEACVNDPKGDPENTLTWDEVKDKFRTLTCGFLQTAACEEVIAMCANMENLSDCGALMRAINRDFQR